MNGRGRMTLRARLTAATACALAVAICVGFFAAYFVVRSQLRGEVDRALKQRASAIIAIRQRAPPTERVPDVPMRPPQLGGASGYIQFVDADGDVSLMPGEETQLPAEGADDVAAGRRDSFFSDATISGSQVRILTMRFDDDTAVQIARSLDEVDSALSRIRLLFLLVSLTAVACAAVLGLAVSRTVLRPVRRLTEDAERIATTGNLNERTDASRSDELGRLAAAFNTMLAALRRSVNSQRQLVADASHELRTPLASARANLELVHIHATLSDEERRRLVDEALRELREMTSLVEELVELAHGDAETPAKERLRLDLLVEDVIEAAERRTTTPIRAKLEPSLVEASPSALARAIANLIDNALKWSPPGQAVEVEVAGGVVKVRDHGPGIDPADLPHVFDRFYRAPAARTLPGSGLGLAIVRQVAEAHGGSVTAERATNGGSLFILRLPFDAAGSAAGTAPSGEAPSAAKPRPARSLTLRRLLHRGAR